MRLEPRAVFGGALATGAPVRERADIGCLLVSSVVDSSFVASALGEMAGFAFPLEAGPYVSTRAYRVLWLTPRSWLVHCPIDEEWALASRINAAFADKRVYAARFSDSLCWLELFGVESSDLLTQGGFISLERGGLPIGHAKRTLIANIAALVVREGEGMWLIGIERSRAPYFVDWLIASARQAMDLRRLNE